MIKSKNRLYDIAFLLLLPLASLFTLPYHHGFSMGDDYLTPAYQLLHSKVNLINNHWANRLGTYLPYAIGMWLFGFGTWLTAITTLEYLLLLIVVYWVLGKQNKTVGFIAAYLLGVSGIMQENAAEIMADMADTLATNGVILAYFYYAFFVTEKTERTAKHRGIFIAVLVVWAILVKESIVFYMPLLLFLFYKDHKETGGQLLAKYFMLTVSVAGLVILAFYTYETGDAFYRLHIIQSCPSTSDCNYANASAQTIFSRITWQPILFVFQNYSFGCLFFLTCLQLVIPSSEKSKAENFFTVFAIGTIPFWWFGTQSFSSYNPLALLHRIWLPLTVPMAINSAFFIYRIILSDISATVKRRIRAATLFLVCLSFLSLWFSSRLFAAQGIIPPPHALSVGIWYSIIAATILLSIHTHSIVEIIPPVKSLFFCVLIVPFLSGELQQLIGWADKKSKGIRNENDWEKDMVLYTISLNPSVIIADQRLADFYYIHTMDMEKKLPFKDYAFFSPDSLKEGDYLLLNPNRELWAANNISPTLIFTSSNNKIPDFVIHPVKYGFVLIKENEADRLYQLRKKP